MNCPHCKLEMVKGTAIEPSFDPDERGHHPPLVNAATLKLIDVLKCLVVDTQTTGDISGERSFSVDLSLELLYHLLCEYQRHRQRQQSAFHVLL